MNIALLMDDIHTIKTYKDTSFALLLAAQARGHSLFYFRQQDWWIEQGRVYAWLSRIEVFDHKDHYVKILAQSSAPLSDMDIVFQRKDPPFNMDYIYDTYMLDLLEQEGVVVVNPPAALRQVNEKFFISRLPQCTPPTLITRRRADMLAFLEQHRHVVAKPLDGMGGMGIFQLRLEDSNLYAILDTIAPNESKMLMLQKFIPEVSRGDKRIIMIEGEAIAHGLLRVPREGEFRANLAVGGQGVVEALSEREQWICAQVAPLLREKRLLLVGLDVIGGYLTEINVTSPTCVREIMAATGEDISGRIIDAAVARKRATQAQ